MSRSHLLETCPASAASSASRLLGNWSCCGGPSRGHTLCLFLLPLLHAHLCRMNALILIRGAQVVLVCQGWVQIPKAAGNTSMMFCCSGSECANRSGGVSVVTSCHCRSSSRCYGCEAGTHCLLDQSVLNKWICIKTICNGAAAHKQQQQHL